MQNWIGKDNIFGGYKGARGKEIIYSMNKIIMFNK